MDARDRFDADLDLLTGATAGLLRTVAGIDDATAAAPCALPHWSRAALLTHLARNADATRNLVAWARDGVVRPMYPSVEGRNADIAAGADRPAAALRADVEESAARLDAALAEVAALPNASLTKALSREVVFGPPRPGAVPLPAASLPALRAREVAIHHADLALAHGPADWDPALARRILVDTAAARCREGGLGGVGRLVWSDPEGPSAGALDGDRAGGAALLDPHGDGLVLHGPAWALAWWCAGRSGHEAALTASAGGPVPAPVPW